MALGANMKEGGGALPDPSPVTFPRPGRRPATTKAELTRIGIELFTERGFDTTTVDDIATAAGIGRRTFFRYFDSKNDLPWGDFDTHLDRMRQDLRTFGDALPLMDALRVAIVEFNRIPPGEIPNHRRRMHLLLTVPALLAHSTLRYQAWRGVLVEYVAHRLGLEHDAHVPNAIAWAMLGVALSTYEQWLRTPEEDLTQLLDDALLLLASGFSEV